MLNLRYWFRLTVAFISKFKGLIILGILIGILVFFISGHIFPILFENKVEAIGITGRYSTQDLPEYILSQISDGLTKVDDQGLVEPSLASSWQTPDKGKTWIFTLKGDKVWEDGKKVTSDTVIYEFSDVQIERPDDKTIIFKLQDPFSPFPSVVSRPTFRKGLLGTGNWKVENVTVAAGNVQELVLKNKKHTKIYKFYPTEERTKLAFKLGEIDEILDVLDPTPFETWKTTDIKQSIINKQVVTLFFNTKGNVLSDKSLRQALAYAIDKKNLGERAISPIPPNSWAYNPQVKTYEYNPDRAKELIGDLNEEVKKQFPITLVSTPALLPIAEEIANYWKGVGVDTQIQVSSIIPSEPQAFLTIFDLPKDPDQYTIWHSTQQATNISNFANQRVDKLLEDGRSQLSLEERKKTYLDFQRFLLEESPAVFLYHPAYYTISKK